MSAQREIKMATPLLDGRGNLRRPGWARRMNYLYNRHKVAGRPFGLKEWDFYQIVLGKNVLQMTIGHVSYMAQFAATLFNIETGERHGFSHMRPLPLRGIHMPLTPDAPSLLTASGRDFEMAFETGRESRRLTLRADGAGEDGPVDIDLVLPHRGDDEMVIATPFGQPGQFYLNCKAHFYGVRGHARFGGTRVEAGWRETALLDWGRGVWPFHQKWFWGCGGGSAECEGAGGRFGFNIGWGFGDLSHATENIFFWEGKAHKLGRLQVERNESNYLASWHFFTVDGRFDLTMTPVYDNDTATRLAFVDNRCHQVFGMFNGRAMLPDGKPIEVRDFPAFCEHAVNNW